MPRILLILQTLFSVWMLVDAIRRRAQYWWFVVIMMPFGELFYFFMVKIHDPQLAWLKQAMSFKRRAKVSIDRLRFNLEQAPSFANKLALAQALYDEKLFVEAAGLFEQALKLDGSSKDALFGLGLSQISQGNSQAAIEPLGKLIEIQPSYQEYAGWSNLAFAFWQAERRDETLHLLAKLVELSPRLSHRLLYAHYLVQVERKTEAVEQLRTALLEDEHAPPFLRRRNRVWSRQARQMLKELEAPS